MLMFLCCCAVVSAQQTDTTVRKRGLTGVLSPGAVMANDKGSNLKAGNPYNNTKTESDTLPAGFIKRSFKHINPDVLKGMLPPRNLTEVVKSMEGKAIPDSFPKVRVLFGNPRFFRNGDTVWRYSGICKVLQTHILTGSQAVSRIDTKRPPLLTVHGNLQYDFLYRSYQDTPFYQRDFRQHSIKTTFSLMFRNMYPVRLTAMHRNSNSPYFRDITDVSVQFSQQEYLKQLRGNLLQQSLQRLKANYELQMSATELLYKTRKAEADALYQWLSSPARLQELVAERERQLKYGALIHTDSLNASGLLREQLQTGGQPAVPAVRGLSGLPQLPDEDAIKKAIADKLNRRLSAQSDSILEKAEQWLAYRRKLAEDSIRQTQTAWFIEKKKKELEALRKELSTIENKMKSARKALSDSLNRIKQELMQVTDPAALRKFLSQKKLDAKELPKGWKTFSAIRNIGIGRTWLDYSELTVKNISLTGINVEVNPGNFYFAAAAGRINYRFRDFVVNNSFQPAQSVYVVRAGAGRKEGNNFIITWYDGKRNLLIPSAGTNPASTPERVIGMSAEVRLQVNNHQSITAEFAKSSFHNTGSVNQTGQALFEKVKNFKDHSNEAYSIRVNSYWPASGTKVSGYYKKMGEHFQSFNLQPVNSVQEAFQLKLQQSLWKKRLVIDAGIRKNDFSNPFLNPGISSQTVFKSLQASLKVPKYPFISVGYAPSSQLTMADNQRLVENQYNTLNAVMSYSYKAGQMRMVTGATYLKFYNSSPDTGFIYYNAASFSLNQVFYLKDFQLQTGITFTDQEELSVFSLEQSATWQFRSWFSVTGGLRYNQVRGDRTRWGANAGVNLVVNKIGMIQFGYDKSYLPGAMRNLLPVETGRVTYFKTF